MILKSRFVAPVGYPVIEDGAVEVRDGCIVAVGRARDVSAPPDPADRDFADAVICPGFVNAHAHLELSMLAGRVPPTPDFAGWLLRLGNVLSEAPPTQESTVDAVRAGVCKSLAAGVTTIGDITHLPAWTRTPLAQSPLRAVSFGEVIAVGRRRNLLRDRLEAAASLTAQTERLRIGISPHAPYTVEPEAMRACARAAQRIDGPLSIHLCESRSEDEFTRSGTGPLADFLRSIDVWDAWVPATRCDPLELIRANGLLGSRTLLAHANYLSDSQISKIARSGASVAYCPRTHAAFAHEKHRFTDMLAAGINVCIGTDSLASNPSLSILDELRHLRRQRPDVAPDTLLAMGTIAGARALECAHATGSIEIGKAADLAVIPLPPSGRNENWDMIFELQNQPATVYISGVAEKDGDP
ncbi:MAG: amidohydrolase family protein [Planctomycetes bacterium]|nr:amidohydrolase family protein [Planctomycetota bacterium]